MKIVESLVENVSERSIVENVSERSIVENVSERSIKVESLLLLCFIVLEMTSCGLYGKYKPVDSVDSTLYGEAILSDTSQNIAAIPWREIFTDPYLQSLIDTALVHNYDLRIAHEHVEQARAMVLGAQLAYLPTVAIVPSGGFSPQYGIHAGTYDLVAQASWEIDIFGRTLNSLRRSKAAREQMLDYEQAARCSLIAGVAETYYTLLMLDAQLEVAQQTSQIWEQTVTSIRRMKNAGMATEAGVAQLEATYYAIQTTVLDLQQDIHEVENALCFLTATTRHTIPRQTLNDQVVNAQLVNGVGLPIQLLYNRPDVRAAQQTMAQAHYARQLATANCLPSLNLSGLFGWTNHSYATIIDPMTMISNLAASLFVPIFNSGRNIAQVRASKSQQEESRLQFAKIVLNAGNEVNQALVDIQTAQNKAELYDQQVEALTRAQHATQLMKSYSNTTYLEVLTAQNNLLQAQFARIANRMDILTSTVTLYHALGGGAK